MILYGALTDVSVGDLFIAGIFPGLILTGFFLVYTVIHARKRGYVRTRPAGWKERATAFRRSAWGLVEDASLMEVFQGNLPFMLLMLAVLILVILFPQLSLWLPCFSAVTYYT